MSYTFAEKEQMYAQNPLCHWCGKPMRLYKSGEVKPYERIPDDAVTIDHIYPLHTNQRNWYKKMKRKSPVVLACNKCNNFRNATDYAEFKKIMKRRNHAKIPVG